MCMYGLLAAGSWGTCTMARFLGAGTPAVVTILGIGIGVGVGVAVVVVVVIESII